MGLAHNALDLVIDALGGLSRVVLVIRVVAAEEDLVLRLAKHLRTKLLAHAQARDHLARDLRGALEVIAGTGGDVVAEELLRSAATQQHGDLVEHAVACVEEVVLLRKRERVAQGLATRDDRDLVHRVRIVEDVANKGVPALVIGDGLALLCRHDAALALGAGDDALHCLLDLGHGDLGLVAAGSEKGALVHEVHEVRAGEARGELGEALEVDIRGERLVLRVDAKDVLAAEDVRTVDRDLTVEAAGAQQRRVEDVRAVGGGDEDHRVIRLEAVHLDEELVERLLALVMATAEASASLAADSVNLVDEDDAGARGLGLLEEVANAARANTHEHLHEVRAGDGEERHARLAGDGLGKQRLARARRANEQHAARDLGAHLLETLGLGEEVANLPELLDSLVHTGDVGELDLGARLLRRLRLGLAEAHGATVLVLHAAHEVDEDSNHDQRREDGEQEGLDPVIVRGIHHVGGAGMLLHELRQGVGANVGALEGDELGIIADVLPVGPVLAGKLTRRRAIREVIDAILLDGGDDVIRGELRRARLAGHEARHEGEDDIADKRERQDGVNDAAALVARIGRAGRHRGARALRAVALVVLAHATYRKPPA